MGATKSVLALQLVMLVVAIMSAALISTTTAARKPCQQRNELFAFKENLGNGPYFKDWTVQKDCCEWKGVTCNDGGTVTEIVVNMSDTRPGIIPDNLAKFTDLSSLYIGYDLPNVRGPIPTDIKSLTHLKQLTITGTKLSGQIQAELGQIPTLSYLDLSYNGFTGGIESLASSATIVDINLSHNSFSGSLPTTLPPALKTLLLDGNKYSGEITDGVAKAWSGLEEVGLSDNNLEGTPELLFAAGKSLRKLDLAGNQFYFNMSNAVLPTGLTDLDLSRNLIYRTISKQVNDLKNLKSFNVRSNLLFGAIPSGVLSNMPKSSFENNICLCDKPLDPCPCCINPVPAPPPPPVPSPPPVPTPPPAPIPASGHVDLLQDRSLPLHLRRPYA